MYFSITQFVVYVAYYTYSLVFYGKALTKFMKHQLLYILISLFLIMGLYVGNYFY